MLPSALARNYQSLPAKSDPPTFQLSPRDSTHGTVMMITMPDARKRPCCICRHWFGPDPRVGVRQRACGKAECQAARRRQTQASWRKRNPDYFIARRIQQRGVLAQPPEPLRLPAPLCQLPWDIAQDEFGVQGADFIGVMGTLLLDATQDQFRAYRVDSQAVPDTLPPPTQQDPRPLRSD
jgi:hypothetical protein